MRAITLTHLIRQAAYPSTTSPARVAVGVGRQPLRRDDPGVHVPSAHGPTATAVTAPSQVVSKTTKR